MILNWLKEACHYQCARQVEMLYEKFYQQKLVNIWYHAVNLYEEGHRDAQFSLDKHLPFLVEMGMNKMDVFDFAEDWVCEGEPDMATFLLIHEQRRDYFWEVQNRKPSTSVGFQKLPAKDAEVNGIRWLPRIIPKAKAKLRVSYLTKPCSAVEVIETFSISMKFIRLNFYLLYGEPEMMIRKSLIGWSNEQK